MKEQVIQLMGLRRDKILQDKKIAKTKFYELDDFDNGKKKIFTDEIVDITLLAILNEETINIASYKDDEVNYSEVYVVYVELKKNLNMGKIVESIQKNIVYPVIVVFGWRDRICLATARKRLSLNEKGKQVVESEQMTDWLSVSDQAQAVRDYLKGLDIANFSFLNLYEFYREYSLYVYQSVLMQFESGFHFRKQLVIDQIKPEIERCVAKSAEVKRLQEEEKMAINFGDRIAVHQKLIEAQKEEVKAKEIIKKKLINT